MCFPFSFGASSPKKRKGASPSSSAAGEKKRRERPHSDALRGDGAPVAEVQEKRRSSESRPRKTRSRESPRREERRNEDRAGSNVYRSRAQYKAPLNLEVPTMWHRTVDLESTNSSEEMLLNPRPQRTQHHRQRHAKQATLRGHGAKREKSRKDMRPQPSAWSFFSPSTPPKTPKRRDRDSHHYQSLDSSSSPRSHHRSPRAGRTHRSHSDTSDSPPRSQPQQQHHRHHRSRQPQQTSSSSRARQATSNTSVRRVPDRRFAVLAATNTALEDLRREAFAQSTPPPPRRERLRRYQGVTLPAASIPYTWDCVSSSQNSTGYGGEASSRRSRRAQ